MNNLKDYFHTDWGAMTQHDWVGLIMTIVVFFVMVGLYVYVFHPSNKERFEARRFIPFDEQMDDDPDFPKQFPDHFSDQAGTEEQK